MPLVVLMPFDVEAVVVTEVHGKDVVRHVGDTVPDDKVGGQPVPEEDKIKLLSVSTTNSRITHRNASIKNGWPWCSNNWILIIKKLSLLSQCGLKKKKKKKTFHEMQLVLTNCLFYMVIWCLKVYTEWVFWHFLQWMIWKHIKHPGYQCLSPFLYNIDTKLRKFCHWNYNFTWHRLVK